MLVQGSSRWPQLQIQNSHPEYLLRGRLYFSSSSNDNAKDSKEEEDNSDIKEVVLDDEPLEDPELEEIRQMIPQKMRLGKIPWNEPRDEGEPYVTDKVREIGELVAHLSMKEVDQVYHLYCEAAGIEEKQFDEDMRNQYFGAAQAAAVGGEEGAGVEAEAAKEKDAFDVVVTGFEAKAKIKVIKEVRALSGLGLKEAKEFVESLPKKINTGIGKKEAEEMVEKLTAAGATVELE
eukprot:CAMPEP_0113941110 /NCGR_PEP_ID=MMETSP1339-20121228/7109_1 /TAXON_ID=94617 /ORGANISM="Fibrocapsa japonica" /LENGTH=233 /DNA_ID=CAMNT_0000945171 /DNA_START=136 /DNA_END=837 /DNA_ORIENTATION=+ /assembly_acc=CAM_ASM_000762